MSFEEDFTDEEAAEIEELMNKPQQKTLNGDAADPEKVKGTPESQERMYRVLELLGFTFSKEEKGERWRKQVDGGNLKVAIDFNDENPDGRAWAKPKSGEFLSDDEVRELPIMRTARQLWASDEPLPPAVIVANVIAKSESGRGILIEFEDAYEGPRQIWYGEGAVKTNRANAQGYEVLISEGEKFIPAGFSKKTKTSPEAKLKLPRPIVLPDYEQQRKGAPIAAAQQNGESGAELSSDVPAPPRKTMNEAAGGAVTDTTDYTLSGADHENPFTDLMRSCLKSGVAIVNEILVPAYHVNDETKADLALRIAQSLFIDEGKNRRAPRY